MTIFFITLVSPRSQNAMIRWNDFWWKMLCCDPHIEEIPRSAIFSDFPLSWNSNFSRNTRLKSFIQASIEMAVHLKEHCFQKTVVLCLRHILHCPRTLKRAIIFDRAFYSNWKFSETPSSSSSIKILIETFITVDEEFSEKSLILILGSKRR